MVVIQDERNNGWKFNTLNVGDVFDYENTYAMKILEVKSSLAMSTTYNAVDLQSGKLLAVQPNTYVTECQNVTICIED